MNVEPSARLLSVPAIGIAAVLLMTVKTVPTGPERRPIPVEEREYCARLVTPLATTAALCSSHGPGTRAP